MHRRTVWILLSFFTRPVVAALCVSAVLFGGCMSLGIPGRRLMQTNFPQMPPGELVVDSVASLEMVRREGRQAEVDAINLNFLWADMEKERQETANSPKGDADPSRRPERREYRTPGDAFFKIVDEFPNLRIVYLHLYGTTAGMEQVARLPKLQYLAVNGTAFGDTVDIGWLSSAKRLRYLELSFQRPLTSVEPLAELPRLETLVFRSELEVTDEVLAETARLEHLKTLVLATYSTSLDPEPFTPAGFAALGHSKSLQTLYVGAWQQEIQDKLLQMARQGKPGVPIEPALVEAKSPLTFFLLYPAGMLGAAVGVGLSGWFRGPMCRLAPHFGGSHAAAAIGLALLVVVISAWRIAANGNDPLASTIVTLAVVSATCSLGAGGMVEAQMQLRDRLASRTWAIWLKQGLFFFLLGALVLPSVAPALLQGEIPWLLAAMGLVTPAAVALTVFTLRGLLRAPEVVDLSARQGMLSRNTQYRPGWMFATDDGEARIERFAQWPMPWTWWQRVCRWRAGNVPVRGLRMLAAMLLVLVPMLLLMLTILLPNNRRGATFDVVRGQALAVAALLLFATSMRVASSWRLRLLSLPLEVLRPYNRRALQNEMAAALVADLVPSALLLAAFEAIGLNLDRSWQVAWARVPLDFCIVTAAMLPLVVGLAAAMVVIKREWLAAAVVLISPGVLVMAVGALAIWPYSNPSAMLRNDSFRAFLYALWLPGVVGTILAVWMYRRWLATEIGSRA